METEAVPLLPLPFEDPERHPGFWGRVGGTLALAFKAPMEFFERIPAGDATGKPLGFMLLFSVPMYLFLCLYPAILGFMGLATRLGGGGPEEPPFHWIALGCLGGIAVLPLLQVAAALFSGLFQYLFLRLWGVHDPAVAIEQDMRAWLYVQGFLAMAFWTPLGPVMGLGVMIVAGLGFARMHRVAAWRGLAAALTHVFLVVFALVAGFVLMMLAGARAGQEATRARARQGVDSLQTDSAMPPDRILDLHVDQARTVLNGLASAQDGPERTVAHALRDLPAAYPPALNPYDPGRPAFRLGTPEALGDVGLLPLVDYNDPITHTHFRRGAAVEAWTRGGRVRRLVQLER